MGAKSFQDLDTWREAHKLAIGIYKLVEKFPEREKFGLISQMTRSAVSVPSNIAEGFNRESNKEKIQFYATARGSAAELQSQLLIARDIGIVSGSACNKF